MNRTQNFDESVPHSQIFMSCCINAIQFHPVDASILAVGLFSGEVALVDSFKDQSEPANVEDNIGKSDNSTTSINHRKRGENYACEGSGHNMMVTSVHWIRPDHGSYYELISSAKDGHICLWSVNKTNTAFELKRKFVVWSDSLPDEVKVGNRHFSGMKEIGVTQLSCCKDDPYVNLFCTFGSLVFQGDLASEQEAIATCKLI